MAPWTRRARSLANEGRIALSFALALTAGLEVAAAAIDLFLDPRHDNVALHLAGSCVFFSFGLVLSFGRRLLDYLLTYLVASSAVTGVSLFMTRYGIEGR